MNHTLYGLRHDSIAKVARANRFLRGRQLASVFAFICPCVCVCVCDYRFAEYRCKTVTRLSLTRYRHSVVLRLCRCTETNKSISTLLANVRYMLSPVRLLSVVCNARAPYSGGWNFRQYFYGIWYLGHPLTSTGNRNPSAGGVKHLRGQG